MEACEEITLQPGESRIVTSRTMLKTVLGSCAGLTFRVERLGLGALCHPMLPVARRTDSRHYAGMRRYVDYAVRELVDAFLSRGARRDEIEAKLFGCCDVLDFPSQQPTIGGMNAETAVRVLAEEAITLASMEVGGRSGMFIRFDTGSGEVWLRRLDPLEPTAQFEKERNDR